jgi:hypothetical protein
MPTQPTERKREITAPRHSSSSIILLQVSYLNTQIELIVVSVQEHSLVPVQVLLASNQESRNVQTRPEKLDLQEENIQQSRRPVSVHHRKEKRLTNRKEN